MKARSLIVAAILFALGVAVGFAAKGIDPTLYRNQPKDVAAKQLLDVAKRQAGKGSWERIAVGRVYYLGGMKTEGQAMFDSVTAKKAESSDWFRIGRVYAEAKDWDKAKAAFERAMSNDPSEKDLAEVGAYYLMNGDRETAEQYFDRSFKKESNEVWATVAMASGYLNVPPQQ